ncbi:acetate uptake transporter [Glaesserella parasuis]|uniref:acetate uptake transporter n=1 Tax=Glaesserella parasuis TaxID=738 RepID=UPI0004ED8496|nr:GPR1/FUN34/YaaH family transporter [Glaesserella parasuis]AIK90193.1 transcriptional regulator [Glaesserella parasuis]MDG6324706.1 acetate uptake transporter [Glaesserella parasuis]MDO9950341.1 acetate uptake transporter [Glaesserella parasuis]MDP0187908.1 acetate uptake transporter [Glaesserella parasuis]MDP0287593.1 acetate uptake transporter [Glaesserella parasuis]
MSAHNTATANPGPLGLCGFALTTWLLSLINNGTFGGENVGLVLAMGFAFGGTAQMIAGMFEYSKGNTFGFTAFISYGAFWWSFALLKVFFGTLTKPRALQAIFLALTITFYLLAAGDFTHNATITHIGGNFGLLTALLAFYLAAAEILNESFGRTVLPIGAPK